MTSCTLAVAVAAHFGVAAGIIGGWLAILCSRRITQMRRECDEL